MRKIVFDFNDIPKTDIEHEPQETSYKKIRTTQEEMYKYISDIMKSQESRVGLGIHAVYISQSYVTLYLKIYTLEYQKL